MTPLLGYNATRRGTRRFHVYSFTDVRFILVLISKRTHSKRLMNYVGWIQNLELVEIRAECAELRASNANLERQLKDTMVSIHRCT
jgi:hypothetical protein